MIIKYIGHREITFRELEIGKCFTLVTGANAPVLLKLEDNTSINTGEVNSVNLSSNRATHIKPDRFCYPLPNLVVTSED